MPRGVDITGQGVKFLVQMDMSQALKMLKDFEQRFQNSERAVDTLSQQMQSQFGRVTNSLREYIEDLNREPNLVTPAGGTTRQVEGLKRVIREVEEAGRTMSTSFRQVNDGGRSLGNTFDTLGNTLKRTNDESRQLEKNLSELADMGNALKSALAFVGLSVGIGAIVHETVEWDKVLTKLELRLKTVGGEYTAIHDDIMKLSKETGSASEEIAQLNTELLQMGVSSRSAQRHIVTITEQMGQMFDVDKSGMAHFFGQLSNLGLAGEKDMKKLADTMAHLASDPNSGPGTTDQDIAAVQSRMGEIQKLRAYLRSEGQLTEDQLNETTNTMMEQIMVVNRKLSKLGIDPEVITNMLRLPGQISEEGGTRSLGFLASGLSQLGMQVNPAELMNEIKKGHIDKAMGVFDQAVAQMAKNPKLIEMVPNEFLQLLMGNLAGGDAKQLIAALENARAAGHGLTKEIIDLVTALAKAHAEGSALDKLWARYKESLGKSWDNMAATMNRIGKQLGIILQGPMKGMVDAVGWVAQKFENFLVWVRHSNTALRTMQGLFVVLAGATGIGAIVKASKIVLDIWRSAAGYVGLAAAGARAAAPTAEVAVAPAAGVLGGAASNIAQGAAAAYAAPSVSGAGSAGSAAAAAETASTYAIGSTAKKFVGSTAGKLTLGIGAGINAYEQYGRVKEETGNTVQAAGAGLGGGLGFVGGSLAGLEAAAPFALAAPAASPFILTGGAAVGGMMGTWMGSSAGQSIGAAISPDDLVAAAAKGTREGTVEGMEEAADKIGKAVSEGIADADQRSEDEKRFGPNVPGSDVPQSELGKKMQAMNDAAMAAYNEALRAYGSPIPVDQRYYDKRAKGNELNYTPVTPDMLKTDPVVETKEIQRQASTEGGFQSAVKRISEDAYRQQAAQASSESELARQHAQALRDHEAERQADVAAKLADPAIEEKYAKLLRDSGERKRLTAEAAIAQAEQASAAAKAKSERMAELAAGKQTPDKPAAEATPDASGTPAVAPPAATAGPAPTPEPPAAAPPPQVTVNVDQSEVVDALKTLPSAFVDGWKQVQNMERARSRGGGMGTGFDQ